MKISVKIALEMLDAIQHLDSYQNGADKPTLYKYDGTTRIKFAIARRILRIVREDYLEARNKLLLEITEGTGELPPINNLMDTNERHTVLMKHMQFDRGDKELLAAQIDFGVEPILVEQLRLEENPIPATVLDMLGSFIVLG